MNLTAIELNNTNIETRVKKFKQYRRKIKADYEDFVKKSKKKDFLNKIEKDIAKINPDLLVKGFEATKFKEFSDNWTKDNSETIAIKNYLDTLRNYNFYQLLTKFQSLEYESYFEPSFDFKGDLSLTWYKQDPKYFELEKLFNWIKFLTNANNVVINNLNENFSLFKDAVYKSNNQQFINNLLVSDFIDFTPIKINKKNKKIIYILLVGFFVAIFFAILFLILFIVI